LPIARVLVVIGECAVRKGWF